MEIWTCIGIEMAGGRAGVAGTTRAGGGVEMGGQLSLRGLGERLALALEQ